MSCITLLLMQLYQKLLLFCKHLTSILHPVARRLPRRPRCSQPSMGLMVLGKDEAGKGLDKNGGGCYRWATGRAQEPFIPILQLLFERFLA